MILARQQQRGSFLDHLESKYAAKSNKKAPKKKSK
jgi:hypothetical protein